MILEVHDRKYRVLFKYDKVYVVRKKIYHNGAYSRRKTRKQPMGFTRDLLSLNGYVWANNPQYACKRITAFIEDITDTDDPKKCPRVEGWAVCSPKDRYCKEKGRRIAFGKALKNSEWGLAATHKESRFEFWLQYFGLKGDYKSIEKAMAQKRKSWKLTPEWDGKRLKCKLLSNKRIVPVTVEWNGLFDFGDGKQHPCNEQLLTALDESLKCSCGEDLWYIDVDRGDLHVPKRIAEYIKASELKRLVEIARGRAMVVDKAKETEGKRAGIPEEDRCPHSDGKDWPCPMKKEIPKSLEWCKANCPIQNTIECVRRGLDMEIQRIASLYLKGKS